MARINLRYQLEVAKKYLKAETRESPYTCNHFEFSGPTKEMWPNVTTDAMKAHWVKFAERRLNVSGLEPLHFEDTPHHRNIEGRVKLMTAYVSLLEYSIKLSEKQKLKRQEARNKE